MGSWIAATSIFARLHRLAESPPRGVSICNTLRHNQAKREDWVTIVFCMSRTPRPKAPQEEPTQTSASGLPLRIWRVAIIGKRGEFLGVVEAPDRETAKSVAARQFNLSDEQRERLVVQERRIGPRRKR